MHIVYSPHRITPTAFKRWAIGWLAIIAFFIGAALRPASAQEPHFAVGGSHVILLAPDGRLWGWGSNLQGQLDPAAARESLATARPIVIPGVSDRTIIKVAALSESTFALTSSGTVFAWGGIGSDVTPARIPFTPPIVDIHAVGGLVYALAANGELRTLGRSGSATVNPAPLAPPIAKIGGGAFFAAIGVGGRDVYRAAGGALRRLPIEAGNFTFSDVTSNREDLLVSTSTGLIIRYSESIGASPLDLPGRITAPMRIIGTEQHTLIVAADGSLHGYGPSPTGELATENNATIQALAALPIALPQPVLVAIGGVGFSAALLNDGRVLTWGAAGDPRVAARTFSTELPLPANSEAVQRQNSRYVSFAATRNSAVAIDAAGNFYEWGNIAFNQPISGIPTQLPLPGIQLRQVSISEGRLLALTTSGQLVQSLNRTQGAASFLPIGVDSEPQLVWDAIATNTQLSVAATRDGRIFQWGSFFDGNSSLSPRVVDQGAMPAMSKTVALTCGSFACFVLRDNGMLYSWGNSFGPLGRVPDNARPANLPGQVDTSAAPGRVVAFFVGIDSIFAAMDSGVVLTWGRSSPTWSPSATRPGVATFPNGVNLSGVQIAGGQTHVIAHANGSFWGVAYGTSRLGLGPGASDLTASQFSALPLLTLPAGVSVQQLVVGEMFSMALGSDGNIYGWGANGTGVLGLASRANATLPEGLRDSSGVNMLNTCLPLRATGLKIIENTPRRPVANQVFEVTLQLQNAAGTPVCSAEDVLVQLAAVQGAATGVTGCQVRRGSSTCRASGIVPTQVGTLALRASAGELRSDIIIDVAGRNQSIAVDQLPGQIRFGDAPFVLPTLTTAQLPVNYTAQGACSVVNGGLVANLVGACFLFLTQPGNALVNEMPVIRVEIQILPRTQTLELDSIPDRGFVANERVTVRARSDRGLPITLRAFSSCTVDNEVASQVRITRIGLCTIVASQNGDQVTQQAPTIERSFQVVSTLDATPDSFAIVPVMGAIPGEAIVSPRVTPAGYNVRVPVQVDFGTFRVGCTGDELRFGFLEPGQSVCLKVTAGTNFNQMVRANMTVGGVAATFTVSTRSNPAIADPMGDADGDGLLNSEEIELGLNPLRRDHDLLADTALGRRLFIRQLYRDTLGREGDDNGISFWIQQMVSGAARPSVAQSFIFSTESEQVDRPIARLFFATFRRIPDPVGLRFWSEQLRRGTSINTVAESFARSPEFVEQYGRLTDREFIDRLYANILNRPVDAAGAAYWAEQLLRRSRGSVLAEFAFSQEFRSSIDSEVSVALTYIALLGRAAEPSGLAFWADRLDRGLGLGDLVRDTIASPEYRARFLE
jgi:alpha-tubulin suppressor-like RCC1 family protein